jgi:hypothetical protein
MSDPSRLHAARQARSERLRERVLQETERLIDDGARLSIAELARRARVSEKFIHTNLELKRQILARIEQAEQRDAARNEQANRLTRASLQAELANALGTIHRQGQQLQALKRRLGEQLGSAVADEHSVSLGLDGDGALLAQERIAQLEEELLAARTRLRETEQELEAARRINRELVRESNQ